MDDIVYARGATVIAGFPIASFVECIHCMLPSLRDSMGNGPWLFNHVSIV